jgi:hypothetical protein
MLQSACGKRICQSSKLERLEVKNIEHLWENILPKPCLTAENRNKIGKLSQKTRYRWYLLLMITLLAQFSVVFIRRVINDK